MDGKESYASQRSPSHLTPFLYLCDLSYIHRTITQRKLFSYSSHMKILAVSDLHGHLPTLPPAEVICIVGDIFPGNMDRKPVEQGVWFEQVFLDWIANCRTAHIILVAGNHDYYLESIAEELQQRFGPKRFTDLSEAEKEEQKLIYLQDQEVTLNGFRFYGTPWTRSHAVMRNKAFCKNNHTLLKLYSQIPIDVNCLLSHDAPFKIGNLGFSGTDLGNKPLTMVLQKRSPDVFICGHLHSGSHKAATWTNALGHTIRCFNVSLCDNNKQPAHKPRLITL